MAIYQFCKNAIVLIQEREHTLKQEVEVNLWQVEDGKTGRIREYTMTQLQEMYANGQLVFPKDHARVDQAKPASKQKSRTDNREVASDEWNEAKIRLAYVKATLDSPNSQQAIKPAIKEVWNKISMPAKMPDWTTVLRWKKQFLSHGKDAFALVKQDHNKGNRTSRYPEEVIKLVQDCIDHIYLCLERPTIEDTLDEAIVVIRHENKQRLTSMQLPEPTRRLVTRLIAQIPSFDRYAARYGRMAANCLFRNKSKHLVTKRPLEAAEMDHTKLDIFVIDDSSHLPLGRPWITICIDCHTRCILGIYIGFEPPSYLSVGKCLKHAILPKTNLQQDYPDIRNVWEAHGVMDRLIVDNGLEFHSLSLEQACFAFNIEIEYTPRKTPWFKGKIERFNGTMNNSACHGVAGTTFSNIFDKADYDPAKHAVLRLSDLRLIIHKWIADYYHQKPHRSLDQQPPAVVWANSIKPEDIQLAHNPAEMDMLLGKTIEQKIVSHKGIELNSLLYNSAELMQIRRNRGDTFKVDIRVDESDIGYVYVMLGHQDHLRVPALNPDAHGVSLWLHNIFRKYTKEKYGKTDRYTYALAKTEIREIVEEAMRLKRKKSNSRVGRYLDAAHQTSVSQLGARMIEKDTSAVIPVVVETTNSRQTRYAPIIQKRGHA